MRGRRVMIGSWAAGTLVVLSVAGCGASAASASSNTTKAGNASGSSNSTQTLKVAYPAWGNSQPTKTWLENVQKQFEQKYKNVQIQLVPIQSNGESQYYTKLDLMERSAKTSPDVVYEDSFLIGPDSAAGYLQPMSNVTQWSGWNQYYSSMQSIVKSNGKIYGAMVGTDVQAIYYNTKLFKEAGLSVPWQPKNWNDILTAAEAIKKHDSGVVPVWIYTGKPLGEASSFRGFEVFLWGTQDSLYNYKTNKWEVAGPGFNKTWSFLQSLYSKGLEEPESDWSDPNGASTVNEKLMPAQQVGIVFDGSWIGGTYIPSGPKPWSAAFTDYQVAKIPTADGQAPHYTDQSGGWALSIAGKSTKPQLATQFIEMAASKDNLAAYDGQSGNMPPRKDIASVQTFQKYAKSDPFIQKTLSFVQYTHYRPSIGTNYSQISNEIAKLTGEISLGQMSAQQAAQEYQKSVTGIVGKSNTETETK